MLLFKLLVAYTNNVRPNNLKQEQKMKNKVRKIVEFTLTAGKINTFCFADSDSCAFNITSKSSSSLLELRKSGDSQF